MFCSAKTVARKASASGLLLFLVFATLLLRAEEPGELPPEATGYPVTIEGNEILRIYEGIGTFTPQQRAEAASERLRKLIFSPAEDTARIATRESTYGTTIVLGDNVLLVVTDNDAKRLHVARDLLANYYARRIRQGVDDARVQHSSKYLIRATIYALATLAVYLVVLWLLITGTRRLLKALAPAGARIKGIKIQQSEILTGPRLVAMLMGGVRLLRFVLVIVFTWIFLGTEFNYFPWTREHGKELLENIITPVRFVGKALLNYLPNVFYIAVIVAAMYYVMKFIRLLAQEIEHGNIRIRGFYLEWVQPTYKIVRFLLITFTAVVIYPYLPGENSPAFKGIGLFIGVLFSLGSTSAVANVVAGVILIYTRGFRIGDWVKIGDNLGEITEQSMLATHLRTIKNEEVIIPNSVVLGSHVTNYSMLAQSKGLILHTSVTIGYDAPWRKIHGLLIEAALRTQYILQEPAPFVLQNALQDSYVQYEINAYTDRPLEMVNIYSELHGNIQDCFYAAGVEIMSPVYHSLRDGNRNAMPAEFLPADYKPREFRIAKDDATAAAASGGKS